MVKRGRTRPRARYYVVLAEGIERFGIETKDWNPNDRIRRELDKRGTWCVARYFSIRERDNRVIFITLYNS